MKEAKGKEGEERRWGGGSGGRNGMQSEEEVSVEDKAGEEGRANGAHCRTVGLTNIFLFLTCLHVGVRGVSMSERRGELRVV